MESAARFQTEPRFLPGFGPESGWISVADGPEIQSAWVPLRSNHVWWTENLNPGPDYCGPMELPRDPSQIYLGGEPVEDERRTAKHRLVRETKRVVDHVALLDVSDGDADFLNAFADEVETWPTASGRPQPREPGAGPLRRAQPTPSWSSGAR